MVLIRAYLKSLYMYICIIKELVWIDNKRSCLNELFILITQQVKSPQIKTVVKEKARIRRKKVPRKNPPSKRRCQSPRGGAEEGNSLQLNPRVEGPKKGRRSLQRRLRGEAVDGVRNVKRKRPHPWVEGGEGRKRSDRVIYVHSSRIWKLDFKKSLCYLLPFLAVCNFR